jgi:hypothetical protein
MLELCEAIAAALAQRGWRLRSGHAPGADQAFERGAGPNADVFLPWGNFECRVPIRGRRHDNPTEQAADCSGHYHPNWPALTHAVRSLHARNCHQILGLGLDKPAAFTVCWTPNASLNGSERNTGGTGQALRLCAALGVPVFNLARPEHLARICRGLGIPEPPPTGQIALPAGAFPAAALAPAPASAAPTTPNARRARGDALGDDPHDIGDQPRP